MVELPLYHIFQIMNKVQKNQDITYDDLARLYGTPSYQVMRMLDNLSGFHTLRKVYSYHNVNQNRYIGESRRIANASSYQARFKRFSPKQGRQRAVFYQFGQRRYKRRPLWRSSKRGSSRFSSRYSY